MPEAVVIIPARLRSTRLPEKALLAETGRPLVVHTAKRAEEAAQASDGVITRVLVATDSKEVAAAVREHGFEAVMTSPDHPTGSDRLAEAAARVEEDIIINLQGDEPETPPETITAALDALLGSPEAAASTCAFPIDEERMQDPALVKVVTDLDGFALYFSRAPIPFRREDRAALEPRALGHVGLYVYRKEALLAFPDLPGGRLEQMEALEQLRFLENGYRMKVAVVQSAPKGIDTSEDYEAFVARFKAGGTGGP